MANGFAPEAAIFRAASQTACMPPIIGSDLTYLGVQSVVIAIPLPSEFLVSVP